MSKYFIKINIILIILLSVYIFADNICPHCGFKNAKNDNICIECMKIIDPLKKPEKKKPYQYQHKEKTLKKENNIEKTQKSCSFTVSSSKNEDGDYKDYDEYRSDYWDAYYEVKRLRKEVFRLKHMKEKSPENKKLFQKKINELKKMRKKLKAIKKKGWEFDK